MSNIPPAPPSFADCPIVWGYIYKACLTETGQLNYAKSVSALFDVIEKHLKDPVACATALLWLDNRKREVLDLEAELTKAATPICDEMTTLVKRVRAYA